MQHGATCRRCRLASRLLRTLTLLWVGAVPQLDFRRHSVHAHVVYQALPAFPQTGVFEAICRPPSSKITELFERVLQWCIPTFERGRGIIPPPLPQGQQLLDGASVAHHQIQRLTHGLVCASRISTFSKEEL